MSEAKADATYRVGVDIGGTFTDLILVETTSGAITVGKSLTTPTDPSEAVETVLRDALDRSGVEAGAGRARHPRHHPGHQQPDRAEGLEDGAADDQGVPRRRRDRARAPLRPVRHLPGDADAAGAALPAAGGRRAGAGERRGRQAAGPGRPGAAGQGAAGEGDRGDRRLPAPQLRQPDPRAAGRRPDREGRAGDPRLDLLGRGARRSASTSGPARPAPTSTSRPASTGTCATWSSGCGCSASAGSCS